MSLFDLALASLLMQRTLHMDRALLFLTENRALLFLTENRTSIIKDCYEPLTSCWRRSRYPV